jgi:hypothetical protein
MTYKDGVEGDGASVMDGELHPAEALVGKGGQERCPLSAFEAAIKEIIRDNLRPTRMNAGDTDRRRLTILLTEAFLTEFAPRFVDEKNPTRTTTKDIEFERAIWDGLKGLCFDCAPLEREMKVYKGVRLGRVALDLSAPAFTFAQKPLGFVEWAMAAATRALEILKEELENERGKGNRTAGNRKIHRDKKAGGVFRVQPSHGKRLAQKRLADVSDSRASVLRPGRGGGVHQEKPKRGIGTAPSATGDNIR